MISVHAAPRVYSVVSGNSLQYHAPWLG